MAIRGNTSLEKYCKDNDMEYLLKEWHPTKNGDLKPSDVAYGSSRKVWWLYPYDDPKTGKHFDFEWKESLNTRTNIKGGCPFLSKTPKQVYPGFNDLETYCKDSDMEYLLKEWHPTKNGDLKPSDITPYSNKKVWWLLSYDDSKTGKHFDFEWQAHVNDRVGGRNGCPFISNKKVYPGFNDLETYCKLNDMEYLLKEWHPTKNGELKPSDVTPKSGKRIWWVLSHDDPKTGKHISYEMEAPVYRRITQVSGCSSRSNWQKHKHIGVNDLETYCKLNDMEYLLKEWHPTKNGELKPSDMAYGSMQKVWWLYPYDDPKTGKHFDFEWKASVGSRVSNKTGCPFLSNNRLYQGFNDLETYCKDNDMEHLLKEWHPTKNGNLKPSDVTSRSGQSIWWLLPYDDPKTGKHFDFEWKAPLYRRVAQESGCPFTSIPPRQIYVGFNDFETYCKLNNMEYLLNEWHPTKNGNLKPSDVTPYSNKTVWWLYPYDDPKTGKHFDFEWQAQVAGCMNSKMGCPFLTKPPQRIYPGFNDLETYCNLNDMEHLLKEWHPTKNGDLKPSEIGPYSNKKIWWILPYDDPKTGKHFDFEWAAAPNERVGQGSGCPILSNKQVYPGFNDLGTYCKLNDMEYVIKKWHPTKNGNLKPSEVTPKSEKKVWWLLPYDDPKTGKHFDFEWESTVADCVKSKLDCPFIGNPPQRIYPGFNDFETYCKLNNMEYLLDEWHPTKNGDLKPSGIAPQSPKEIWWHLPYDDPKTGKHYDFEWKTKVTTRVSKRSGCPFISTPPKQVYPGFNDFETYCKLNNLEHLLKEWHPTKNGDLKPSDITPQSEKKVWWLYPYDDPKTSKHFDFEWQESTGNRINSKTGCPFVSGHQVYPGFNDLETYCKLNDMEYLLKEWHPTKNKNINPYNIAGASNIKRWWMCENGHEWRIAPCVRIRGNRCPFCKKKY